MAAPRFFMLSKMAAGKITQEKKRDFKDEV